MQKLIELLNEYGNEICNHWGDYQTDMDFTDRDTYWYLSKKFGFIKWLVENDKIDLNRIPQKFEGYYDDKREYIYDEESILLMKLAMEDEPIDFLISILK